MNEVLNWYNDVLKNFKEADLAKKIKAYEADTSPILDNDKIHFIRCDGRHFKSYCKGFKKPFDIILRNAMRRTMVALCEEVSGAFIGYTQSDEITIGFKKPNDESDLHFNGRRTKITTSASASCTLLFNQFIEDEIEKAKVRRLAELLEEEDPDNVSMSPTIAELNEIIANEFASYEKKKMIATFDARVFSMDKEECSEAIIWRILDCHKNAIQMIARSQFPLKELHKKKTYEMKDMLNEKGNFLQREDIRNLYGTICYKMEMVLYPNTERECTRKKFVCDEPYHQVLDKYTVLGGKAILTI